ncbi:unnamed protein product, partial [Mesorhabditis belari]|uniref:Uncharacterized protein n=1 Tax=Mesorhabditis belari TaxID=2138241 RepID=A0AAF3FQK6_9BILA
MMPLRRVLGQLLLLVLFTALVHSQAYGPYTNYGRYSSSYYPYYRRGPSPYGVGGGNYGAGDYYTSAQTQGIYYRNPLKPPVMLMCEGRACQGQGYMLG